MHKDESNQNQSSASVILMTVLPGGENYFNHYLEEVIKKKRNDKKRKKVIEVEKKPQYQVLNLVKAERIKLISNDILAKQILKSMMSIKNHRQNKDETEKYYKDLACCQKVNKKFIQVFKKQIRCEKYQNFPIDHIREIFEQKIIPLIQSQTEASLSELMQKQRGKPKPRLHNTVEQLQQISTKIPFLISSFKRHQCFIQLQKQLQKVKTDMKYKMLSSFEVKISSFLSIQGSSKILSELFLSQFELLLPKVYVKTDFCPTPWKTNYLEKQRHKMNFKHITGKILIKYEQNMMESRQKKLKIRTYQLEKKPFSKIKSFVNQIYNKKNISRRAPEKEKPSMPYKTYQAQQKPIHNETQINFQLCSTLKSLFPMKNQNQKNKFRIQEQSNDIEERKTTFISNNLLMKTFNTKQFSHNQNLNLVLENQVPKQKEKQILFQAKNKQMPKRSQFEDKLNLDQYTNSKNVGKQQFQPKKIQYSAMNGNKVPQEMPIKNHCRNQYPSMDRKTQCKEFPVENKNSYCSSPPRQQKTYPTHLKFQKQSNSGSPTWQELKHYQTIKSTKKKSSFMKIANNSLWLNHQSNSDRIHFGNEAKFYPLKIGNLIVNKRNKSFLEYDSEKQPMKNVAVKFILDRIRYNTNDVEIIVPSLNKRQSAKINDQERAKQIINIINSLGGRVTRIKTESSYFNQKDAKKPKISAEIQVYKYCFCTLSVFDIINALNLEKQWHNISTNSKEGWNF